MTLPLEEDPRPPYVQAAEVLRAAISAGELRPGEKLPSARELQRRFGISSSTVQNALRLLKDEGLIYSVLGRGSYVRAPLEATTPPPDTGTPDPAYVGLGDLRSGWQPAPKDDPRPPYIQTADALRKQIQNEQLKPGSKLPSARELQEQFGIANSTAQNALRVLKNEGLIYAVQGRGVFVRKISGGREEFFRRYSKSLAESTQRYQAELDAVKYSGETDEEVTAKAEQAEARVEQADAELEAAIAELRALREDQARRRRVNGTPSPEDNTDRVQKLQDRLDEGDKRRRR